MKTFMRFRLFPFRSPLLRESLRFLVLWLLRCFTSPGYLYMPMDSACNSRLSREGFPIRKSPGHGLLGTSPELIAPCNVLLRLLVSRHPPYALYEIAHNENTKQCFVAFYPAEFYSAFSLSYQIVDEPSFSTSLLQPIELA